MLPAFSGWLPGHVDPANSGHFWFDLVRLWSIDLFLVHLIHYDLHHYHHYFQLDLDLTYHLATILFHFDQG